MKMSGFNKIFDLEDDVQEVNDIETISDAIYKKTEFFIKEGDKLRKMIKEKAIRESETASYNVSIINELKKLNDK